MRVKFKKLHDSFVLPFKGSEHSACFDCVAVSMEALPDDMYEYGLGFSTEFSEKGWKGIIVPRSSFTKSEFVMQNSPAQVDEDYRSEWKVRFRYIGNRKYIIQRPYALGDKICQIYFERVNDVEFEEAEELSDTKRGDGGFGSTGR